MSIWPNCSRRRFTEPSLYKAAAPALGPGFTLSPPGTPQRPANLTYNRSLPKVFESMRRTLAVSLLALLCATAIYAQAVAGFGAITGIVRDQYGDGIPEVTLVITNPSLCIPTGTPLRHRHLRAGRGRIRRHYRHCARPIWRRHSGGHAGHHQSVSRYHSQHHDQ